MSSYEFFKLGEACHDEKPEGSLVLEEAFRWHGCTVLRRKAQGESLVVKRCCSSYLVCSKGEAKCFETTRTWLLILV